MDLQQTASLYKCHVLRSQAFFGGLGMRALNISAPTVPEISVVEPSYFFLAPAPDFSPIFFLHFIMLRSRLMLTFIVVYAVNLD